MKRRPSQNSIILQLQIHSLCWTKVVFEIRMILVHSFYYHHPKDHVTQERLISSSSQLWRLVSLLSLFPFHSGRTASEGPLESTTTSIRIRKIISFPSLSDVTRQLIFGWTRLVWNFSSISHV